MSLSRLQTATDILKARTRAYEAQAYQAHRGMALGDGSEAQPLPLGASAVDHCLDGGLACGGLHEVRSPLARDIGAATGFALGLAARAIQADRSGRSGIVWVSDPATRVDGGGLFPAGLAQYGLDPSSMTIVEPGDLQGAMWAADEAAGCRAGRAGLPDQGQSGALRHHRHAAADAARAPKRGTGADAAPERRGGGQCCGNALAGEHGDIGGGRHS
jgi:protein ImuA